MWDLGNGHVIELNFVGRRKSYSDKIYPSVSSGLFLLIIISQLWKDIVNFVHEVRCLKRTHHEV